VADGKRTSGGRLDCNEVSLTQSFAFFMSRVTQGSTYYVSGGTTERGALGINASFPVPVFLDSVVWFLAENLRSSLNLPREW
jgi:hypothetical protein